MATEAILTKLILNNFPTELSNQKTNDERKFYTTKTALKVEGMIDLYGKRKSSLETMSNAIANFNNTYDGLDDNGKRKDFIDSNPNLAGNGSLKEKELLVKNDLEQQIKMLKDVYDEITNDVTAFDDPTDGLKNAEFENEFTTDINGSVLNAEYNTVKAFLAIKNPGSNAEIIALEDAAAYMQKREEEIERKIKLYGQVLDEDDLRNATPFNYFAGIPTAKTKLVELENANNARKGVLDNYEIVYNAADGKNQQTNAGTAFPTLEDISKEKSSDVNLLIAELQAISVQNQASVQALQTASTNYKNEFGNDAFIANKLNQETDPAKINTAGVERKKLLDKLRDIDIIGFGTLNPGDKSDLILKQTLTTRENLLKDWQAAFSKPNYDDAKGKSSADVQSELDERRRLNDEAKDLFTPAMLANIGSTMNNPGWKQEIADRSRLITDFKDIGGGRNDNYKSKSSQDLKQIYMKRKKAVDELSALYASSTQTELVDAITTSNITELIQKKNAREDILLKLAQAYSNSTPAKVIDKNLDTGDLNVDLANRLQEYKETVQRIEKLSGAGTAGQTDAQTNLPPLSKLRQQLVPLEDARKRLESEYKSMKGQDLDSDATLSNSTNAVVEAYVKGEKDKLKANKDKQDLQKFIDEQIINQASLIKTGIPGLTQLDEIDLMKKKLQGLDIQLDSKKTQISSGSLSQDADLKQLVDTATKDIDQAKAELTAKENAIKDAAVVPTKKAFSLADLRNNAANDDLSTGTVVNSQYALSIINQIMDDEDLKPYEGLDQKLGMEQGYRSGGTKAVPGEIPNMWVQILTNIDEDGSNPVSFVKALERNGKTYNVLNNLLDSRGKKLPGILDASKSSIGWEEKYGEESFFVTSWIRITPDAGADAQYQKFVVGLEDYAGQTVYINLEDRSKVYSRSGFLKELKNTIVKTLADPVEERRLFRDSSGQALTIPVKGVEFYKDQAIQTFNIPVDHVKIKDDANGSLIEYFSAPSKTETVKFIEEEYKKEYGNAYPTAKIRGEIQKILANFFLESSSGRGISWNGGNDGTIDLNGPKFDKEKFEQELKNEIGIIGSEVNISDTGMIDIVPTKIKEDILANPMLPVSEEILTQALFQEISMRLFGPGKHDIAIHRIRKYKDFMKDAAEPAGLELAIQCRNADLGGYCLRLKQNTGKMFSDLRDTSKKLFLFDDAADVASYGASIVSTSNPGAGQQEFLDTDDESSGTFRFIPNI